MSHLSAPRLNLRKFEHFVPFAEFLVGGTRADFKLTGDSNQSAFAIAAGGGVDKGVNRDLGGRFGQLDYFTTTPSWAGLWSTAAEKHFPAGTRLGRRIGFRLTS